MNKVVVRNTMAGYTWGKEERAQPEFPFHPGKPFDIIILVEQDQYKVECSFRLVECADNPLYMRLNYFQNAVLNVDVCLQFHTDLYTFRLP